MDKPIPYQPDALLVKFLLGEANAEEVTEASNWIAASAENETYFHQVRKAWEKSRPFPPIQEIDENTAWKRFQEKLASQAAGENTTVLGKYQLMPFLRNRLTRIAAILILSVSTMALAYFFTNEYANNGSRQFVTTSTIEQKKLPDGSSIVLNKNSSISYPAKFSGAERLVKLQGEGFFSIQPDKNKPFIIQVNDILVKVVGTSFNIREGKGKTEVIVETGIVQVIHKQENVELHPGQKVIFSASKAQFEKEAQTDKLYDYYRTKEFTCDNTPLWKLAEVLGEAYGIEIIISNQAIRNLPLTTRFEEQSLDNILSIIAQTLDIKVEKTAGKIILK